MFDECFIPDEDWGDLFYDDNIDILDFDEVLDSAPDLDDYFDDLFEDDYPDYEDQDESFGL